MPRNIRVAKPRSRAPMQQRKQKRLLVRYFTLVGAIVGIFLLLSSVGVFAYVFTGGNNQTARIDPTSTQPPSADDGASTTDEGALQNMFKPPARTTFLMMGLDQNNALSDIIMVGCFDRDTHKLTLISIPRDTYVVLSKPTLQAIKDAGRHAPADGVMKINAIHSYAGQELGSKLLKEKLEEILAVRLDYTVEISIEAFKKIVDDVNGVDMEIPKPGLHYNDPTQNLVINIPSGMQHLNGDDAEGVVRYRATYRNGDLDRIEVEHTFLKNLFAQVLNKDTLMSNAPQLLATFMSYVKTDFPMTELPKYLPYVKDIHSEDLVTYTLPNTPEYVGDISYVMVNEDETKSMVDDVFFNNSDGVDYVPSGKEDPAASATPTATTVDVKSLRVQILNGGSPAGYAKETGNTLRALGYNIADIGDYAGTPQERTRIVASSQGIGELLQRDLPDTDIVIDTGLPVNGHDIIIITGENAK